MRIIEMVLDEEDEQTGINAISLVDEPGIDSDWVMLEKQPEAQLKVQLKVIDEERKILMGAILIPDKVILRKDENGKPFYIFFSKPTLRKAMQKFMRNKRQGEVTLQHSENANSKAYLTEIWEKEHDVHDKSVMYGIDAPIGSIIGTMKVQDETLLKMAKEGKINGFSVEGFFTKKTKLSMSMDKNLVDTIKKIIQDGQISKTKQKSTLNVLQI